MNKSILFALTRQLTNLVLNRTAVLTDGLRGVEYSRADKTFRYRQTPPSNIDCLIVGKEHYREETRTFPIQSRKELNNILKLEATSSNNVMLYSIGGYLDGQRIVTCWQIKAEVLTKLQLRPLFIVPESALLLSSKSEQLFTVLRAQRTFWFVDRQGHYLSAEKKGLISSSVMFLASAGLSKQIDNVDVEEDAYLTLLSDALLPLLMKNLGGFKTNLRQLSSIDWMPHLKYSGACAMVLLVGYFSLTSVYLNTRLDLAKTASGDYAEQTKDIFELKNQLNLVEQKDLQIAQVNDLIMAPNVIWRLVVPLINRGVEFRRIGMRPDGRFSFEVEAIKATDVLEFINSDPVVLEPQFLGQTSVVDKKERFMITFRIKRGPDGVVNED